MKEIETVRYIYRITLDDDDDYEDDEDEDLEKENARPGNKGANRSFSEADVKAYEEWGRKKLKEASE